MLLELDFHCRKILLKYMTVCQLLAQARSVRALPIDMTLVKQIPKSETKLHKFFAAT